MSHSISAAVLSAADSRLLIRSRTTGIALALGATVIFPLWSLFDHALESAALAHTFTAVRFVCTLAMAAVTAVLWRSRWGHRHPAALATVVLTIVQLTVGWMLPQVQHLELYLLGATLVPLACGAVLTASPWWSVTLAAATTAGIGLGAAGSDRPLTAAALTATCCYLGTACMVAAIGHWLRFTAQRAEVRWRCALENEQAITHQLIADLRRLSVEDSLTGLANRRAWDEQLRQACSHAAHNHTPLAVAIIDIDHFKTINDTRGHTAGDTVLRDVADILRATVRDTDTDTAARLGGDELALLLPDTGPVHAAFIAERIRTTVADLPVPAGAVPVTVSIGIAISRGNDPRPEQLLREADTHLYTAKQTRNRVSSDFVPPPGTPHPRVEPVVTSTDLLLAEEPTVIAL